MAIACACNRQGAQLIITAFFQMQGASWVTSAPGAGVAHAPCAKRHALCGATMLRMVSAMGTIATLLCLPLMELRSHSS